MTIVPQPLPDHFIAASATILPDHLAPARQHVTLAASSSHSRTTRSRPVTVSTRQAPAAQSRRNPVVEYMRPVTTGIVLRAPANYVRHAAPKPPTKATSEAA
jgi:hypothetical protein